MDYSDTRSTPEPEALPDTQAQADERGLVVDRAGIRGLRLPAHITDVDGECRDTVAIFDVSARVRAGQRGTHMSRLALAAHDMATDLQLGSTDITLANLAKRMEERGVSFSARFAWFIEKQAPVSGLKSLLDVDVEIHATTRAILRKNSVELTVRVPVTSLCPCSKAISKYGAHNQRSIVTATLQTLDPAPIGAVVGIIEAGASCPVYSVLKRADEKHVTEAAYENPKFAEDIVRDIHAGLRRQFNPTRLRVETENHESIHNHAAYAQIGDLPWKR